MAIFHELDTSMYYGVAILENANYMTKNINLPRNVPVVEANDSYIAKFSDVSILAEDYDISYLDALVNIAESNNIDPDSILVAIDEADIICYPDLVNEFTVGNNNLVVINPISENCLAYKFCQLALESYIATEDEGFLMAIIDEAELGQGGMAETLFNAKWDRLLKEFQNAKKSGNESLALEISRKMQKLRNQKDNYTPKVEKNMKEYHGKQKEEQSKFGYKAKRFLSDVKNTAVGTVKNNKGKIAIGAGLAAAGGIAYGIKKYKDNQDMKQLAEIQRQMANAPKSWIAKKIASLRSLYKNYMHKAQLAKATGQAGIFTKIAHRILSVIDALMKKMQNIAG